MSEEHRGAGGSSSNFANKLVEILSAFYKKGDYRFAREKNCDLRLLDFETFGGFGNGVRKLLRQAADQLSNKLSHAQHLDEVTWTTKNWHGLCRCSACLSFSTPPWRGRR